jgi:uncharacterized protein (TIGR03663 family)
MRSGNHDGTFRPAFFVGCVLILGLCLLLRIDDLGRYPLHADEAVQATKLVTLLETGQFDYDPEEYHGPLTHFAARGVLRLRGVPETGERESLDASDLRLVPAIIGVIAVALVGCLAFVTWGIGGAWSAMLLAAVSSSMVFFSRYYIAEMLLVACTCLFLLALVKLLESHQSETGGYTRGRRTWYWAALTGIAAGLMHATKETCVLSFAAAAIAGLAVYRPGRGSMRWFLLAVAFGLVTSVAVYSGGFRHQADVWESLTTYLRYLGRAGGGEGHAHPWWFYLHRYAWFRGGYLWSELGVFVLAFAGLLLAWRRGNRAGVFLGVYAVSLGLFYTLIPYKTPWSFLPAFVALFPLTGWPVVLKARGSVRLVTVVVLFAVAGHLGVQARRATHRMPTDPRNPYAYVHTSPDVITLLELVGELDRLSATADPPRLVIADSWMSWPLPWYLRYRDRVSFRDSFPDNPTSPLLLAAQTVLPPGGAGDAWQGYHQKVFGLRADLPLILFVEKNLWHELLRSRGVL